MNAYKQLCIRVRRLPVDLYTQDLLQSQVKKEFSASKRFDKKRFRKYISLLDDVLIYENWPQVGVILDDLYKSRLTAQEFPKLFNSYKHFQSANYNDIRSVFPQVHLFKQLDTPDKYQSQFQESLRHEGDEFSVMDFLKMDSVTKPVELVNRKDSLSIPMESAIKDVQVLYQFISKHDKLTHLKIVPFEVIYPSDKFGLPLHIIQRDKLLHDHLNYVKNIVRSFLPISRLHLDNLELVTNNTIQLNENFFKYMTRKRQSVPVALKTKKSVIPNSKNILKWYKDYLTKQFSCEEKNGDYVFDLSKANYYG